MHPISAFAVAVGSLVAALFLRWVLDPFLGPNSPFITVFGAVALAVWAGGYRHGAVVAVVGYAASSFLFIQPKHEWGELDAARFIALLAYAFTCLLIIGIGEAMRTAKARAAEQGELLRVTLGSIGDAVITTDPGGHVTYLNAVAERLTGWTAGEAKGLPLESVFSIVNENTRQRVQSPVDKALREGTVVGLANHTLLIAKDGHERPIDDSAAPIRDAKGQTVGCVLVFRDVTERRDWEKGEAERLMTARRLAAIVESSDDAIVAKSLDGIVRNWNAGAERLFGYPADEAVGQHISLIIPPDRIEEEDEIIARLKAGLRVDHFETRRVAKDGRTVHVSLTISPIVDGSGQIVGASKIARDITERVRSETERKKFVALVENTTDFVAMSDMQGVTSYVNAAGRRMVGLDAAPPGRPTDLRELLFPEDQARILDELLPAAARDGNAEAETRLRHVGTGQALWMVFKAVAIRHEGGTLVAIALVGQNFTERRELEHHLRALAADLSDLNNRKNEFLATLAHELRNPLAPLRNMLEILKRGGNGEVQSRAIDVMQRQLDHLVRLVDDLLDLNRINHGRFELKKRVLDIATVVSQAVESCRPLAESMNHEVTIRMPDAPLRVCADEVRLTQVLSNLVNNSCKYTNPGGLIEVAVRLEGEEVVLAVRDNGIGIPQDRLADVFGMFMQIQPTAERSQGGLGIGLMLVKKLVEMHGGTVSATSAGEGRGSEFTVRLPLLLGGSDVAAAPAEKPQEPPTVRRVLVVDDNRDAASSLAELLRMTGHEAHEAYDGPSALDFMASHRPEVVLLDIGLPGLNGYEVCRRVREQPWGRDIAIIALTGWGQEKDLQESRQAGFDGHLVKPVEYGALEAQLDAVSRQAS